MTISRNVSTRCFHPLDKQDKAVVAAMRAQTAPFKGAVFGPAGRDAYDAIMRNVPAPEGVRHEPGTVGGVDGIWCIPSHLRVGASVLFLHGGGCVMGSARAYAHFAGHFARRLSCAVFVPDYRLAPEHPFPAAIEDAHAAYLGLLGGGAAQIVVVGDSAGGGLSLCLLSLLRAQATGTPTQPVAAVVMSPWTDLSASGESVDGSEDAELYLTRAMLQACAAMYLGAASASHPQASALNAVLDGLPPIQVHVGTNEILLDDSNRYFELARQAGVDVDLHVWEGMPHVFPNCPGTLQAADRALGIMASFVEEHWGQEQGRSEPVPRGSRTPASGGLPC